MRRGRRRRNFIEMHDLFAETENLERVSAAAPLATRMRPRTLEEFVGQEHILAPGKLLRRAIEADRLPSKPRWRMSLRK
jgi:putative ATPase